jgi:hypothetical protein
MVLLGQSLVQDQGIQYFDANNSKVGPYFNPHGFSIRNTFDPQPYSTFPPGFSIILVPVYGIIGNLDWLYVIPIAFSAIGLAAAAYLGYVLSGHWGSLFAVALVGTSHVVVAFSTSLWSDGPSLSLLLAGLALSIWAVRSGRKFIAAVAGLCLGLFILFKFVNVVFVCLIIISLKLLKRDLNRAVYFWLLPGVVAGIVGMVAYQSAAYGSPWANAYQPWGQTLYAFPLFSPSYLFFRAPAPWSDISNPAILNGMLTDMQIWSGLFVISLVIDRKNPLRLLLALVFLINVGLYAISVFSPRQFINMRYLLPALAAGYILAADVLARLMRFAPKRTWQGLLAGVVIIICLSRLIGTTFPDLAERNRGTANAIQQVIDTARTLPPHSVVLAYSLADSFILYGKLSVLNYRRMAASSLEERNTLVRQAIDQLLCEGQSVSLVQDDEKLFNTLYPDLAQKYVLRPKATPIKTYEIQPLARDRQCVSPDRTEQPIGLAFYPDRLQSDTQVALTFLSELANNP